MPSLPPAIVPLLSPFAPLFNARIWRKVQVLLTGGTLAPDRRTVSTALLGLQGRGDLALFHHVLSRASRSSLAVSWALPSQLVRHLVPSGPFPLVINETLERHWDEKIEALGVSRPGPLLPRPLRQGQGAALGQPDAAGRGFAWRVWVLPFLTVLAPSRRYHEARGHWMLYLLRRWLSNRELVVVEDRTYATLKLPAAGPRHPARGGHGQRLLPPREESAGGPAEPAETDSPPLLPAPRPELNDIERIFRKAKHEAMPRRLQPHERALRAAVHACFRDLRDQLTS